MKDTFEVVVIGAGPTGLKAAVTLATHGVETLLVDENHQTGGQYLRRPPSGPLPLSGWMPPAKRAGLSLIEKLPSLPSLTVMSATTLLSLQRGFTLALQSPGGLLQVKTDRLIIATGTRERLFPFPGWTLPGVMAAGGVQLLLKEGGKLPGRRTVVAGTGPFLFSAAAEIVKRGGEVVRLLEERGIASQLPFALALASLPSKTVEGFVYMEDLLRKGAVPHFSERLVAAEGNGKLERVTIAKVNRRGEEIPGSRRSFETDTAAISGGFLPNTELFSLLEVPLKRDPSLGGWVVPTLDDLHTSLPGLYAAGEVTGVGGAEKALLEGELAALSLREDLGRKDSDLTKRKEGLIRRRRGALRYSRALNTVYPFPKGLFGNLPPETILCRCEEVSLKDVREAFELGCDNLSFLKVFTRTGMGPCQGRTCHPLVEELFSLWSETQPERPPSSRFPSKPYFPFQGKRPSDPSS